MFQLRTHVPALYTEPNIISEIRKGRLKWLGHVERMPEERTVKKVFKNILEGKRFS
jgi:hypothetical protein